MIAIGKNKMVSIRYVLKNSSGDILEDTMSQSAVSYLHGLMSIDVGLQLQLEGLRAGEEKTIYLSRNQTQADDCFIFDVIIDDIRTASEYEILQGFPVKEETLTCGPNCNC